MNRTEFIGTLKKRLECLPADEKESALCYYEEFFDDAGVENEQNVINNLGSPDDLADTILKSSGYFIETNAETDIKTNSEEYYKNRETDSGVKNNSFNSCINNSTAQNNACKSDNRIIITIIVLVLTFPFWIGIVSAAFGIIIAVLATAFALLVCLSVLPVALIIGAVLTAAYSPVTSIFMLGATAICIGVLILIIPFIKYVFIGIGYCFKGVIRFLQRIFGRSEVK